MMRLNLDFSACPPNCCLSRLPTQIPHLMQFQFVWSHSCQFPTPLLAALPAPAPSTVFCDPALKGCRLLQCLCLLGEPPGKAKPTTGWGTRSRSSEHGALQCAQRQSHCHGLCPLGPFNPGASAQLSCSPRPVCLPGISSMEVRTYWNYCWGQSALFGSKVGPLSCCTRLLPQA